MGTGPWVHVQNPDCVILSVKTGLDSSAAGRPRWVTLHSLLRADLGQNPKEVASSFQQPSDQAESPARPSPGLGSLLSSPYPPPPLTREHPRKWPVGGGRSGTGRGGVARGGWARAGGKRGGRVVIGWATPGSSRPRTKESRRRASAE